MNHTDEVTAIGEGFKLSGEELGMMQLKAVDAIFDRSEELKEKLRQQVKVYLQELK